MTRIVCISDSHGHKIELPEGDILLHSGDFCMAGTIQEFLPQLQWLTSQKKKFKHVVITMGNHDGVAERQPGLVKDLCKIAGVIYLQDETVILEGIKIFGSPYSPEFCNWFFNVKRGEDIRRHWDLIEENTDIIMTHGPVQGILDEVPRFTRKAEYAIEHVGCKDLADKVFQIRPKLHVCGHIHGSYGQLEFNGTKFVNASIVNESYQVANEPIIVEI